MSGYATARQNGWMSANDIRELENLDRIPSEDGGDMYLVNGNMLPAKGRCIRKYKRGWKRRKTWMKNKIFWRWKNQASEQEERVLELYGTIAEEAGLMMM